MPKMSLESEQKQAEFKGESAFGERNGLKVSFLFKGFWPEKGL